MRETRVADATSPEPVTLAEYPEVIDDLRRVFLCAPSEELVTDHVANMLVVYEATRFLSRDSRRRRRGFAFGSALGVGALVGGAGLAAASGNLPDGLQSTVARVAEPLGIDVPDGNADEAPGRGGENPSRADEAPGQQKLPGGSENAPGHGGENPGRSETAPGHSGNENNKPESPPGLTGEPGNAPDQPPGQADKATPPGHAPQGAARSNENSANGADHAPQRGPR